MARRFSMTHHRALALALATAFFAGGGTYAGLALGSISAASAQDQPAGAAPAGANRGRMGKILMSLDLSDAQKTQIRGIMADVRKQNENVSDRDQKRANYQAAMTKVKAVLTPAQRNQLDAKLAAMRQQNSASHS